MTPTHRLVIFDVDGTLIDSQHHIHAAMTAAFAEAGLPGPTLPEVHAVVGLSLPLALARLRPELPEAVLEAVARGYKSSFLERRLQEDAPLYPGARDCLAALRARGLALGVATGKGRRGLMAMLAHHGLDGAFDTLQCADDHPSKPDPAMLRAALAETGVPADAAAMIGDTSFDMEMAGAAGVAPIGVAWGYHPAAALTAAGAGAVAADFPALTALLLGAAA